MRPEFPCAGAPPRLARGLLFLSTVRLALLAFSFLSGIAFTACAQSAATASPARPGWKATTKPVRNTSAAPAPKPAPKKVALAPKRAPIVEKAQAIQQGALPSGRRDCTGYVMAAYSAAGVELQVPTKYQTTSRMSEQMYLWARGEGRAFKGPDPKPGDLVFFRDTYGTINGDITHVALVEKIESDGTIVLLHRLNGGIKRDKMNLSRPEDPAKNAYLRKKLKAGEPTLTGQLFVAFGRFDGPI